MVAFYELTAEEQNYLTFGRQYNTYQTVGKLDSTSVQSNAYGRTIPYGFGRRRMVGNLIWAKDLDYTVTETRTPIPVTIAGYIGVGGWNVTSTYSYKATFAVSFGFSGRGTTNLLKLWANNTLIYDSDTMALPSWITFYSGTETQTPDPTIAADKGADTPSYRPHVYAVIRDLDISPYANTIPAIIAEIGTASGPPEIDLDFTTATYTVGGTSYAFGDLYYLSFGTAGTIDSNGLRRTSSGTTVYRPDTALTDAMALLQNTGTLYVEYYPITVTSGFPYSSVFFKGVNGVEISANTYSDFTSSSAGLDAAGAAIYVADELNYNAVNKLAITWSDSNIRFCINGGTIHTDTVSTAFDWTTSLNGYLWLDGAEAPYIRKVRVISAQGDAALQSLTT